MSRSTIPVGFRALPLPLVQLSLSTVLNCGQSFRWSAYPLCAASSVSDGSPVPACEYRFCLRDRVVCLRQSSDVLFYRSAFPQDACSPTEEALRDAETLTWLKDYFQLDVDLCSLYEEWSKKDPVFARLRDRFEGIRMLRQDPWENLVSFICSSNNNIARITKMVQALCKHYSPPLLSLPPPPDSEEVMLGTRKAELYYAFPTPSALSGPDVGQVLRSLGFGYRAEYVQKTATMLINRHGPPDVASGNIEASAIWLSSLRSMDTHAAREELLKFVGVGRKVADCILLMSLNKSEVIPVDTHVHQIAIKHYGFKSSGIKSNMSLKLYDEVSSKLKSVWGRYAGWAHSILFTADLKSFANHGLPVGSIPSSSPMKAQKGLLPTPPPTPSPSPLKRKHRSEVKSLSIPNATIVHGTNERPGTNGMHGPVAVPDSLSLADRVKRRRRVATKVMVMA